MNQSLAVKMRPSKLNEVLGQEHILGPGKILNRFIEKKQMMSIIFYGPPGSGKTTLAYCLANDLDIPCRMFNAATGNKKAMDQIIEEAKLSNGLFLIIDEVHRLNKDKQDHLLPHIENGLITIVGCTTANPFHSINPAIRSRCHLIEIKQLSKKDIIDGLSHAIASPLGLNQEFEVDKDAIEIIASLCGGDIRYAYNCLELCSIATTDHKITAEIVKNNIPNANVKFDKSEDYFYDTLSGFQKSIRGSDADAALFYLARLIQVGDMESIERRLITTAYEDVGLANPQACAHAVTAIEAAKKIGFPEARIPLAVAVIELALSPKSKSGATAIDTALQMNDNSSYTTPNYLRLTPVGLAEDEKYDYSKPELWEYIQYLPQGLEKKQIYVPWLISDFEKSLAIQHQRIIKHGRTSDIKRLNNAKKKKTE